MKQTFPSLNTLILYLQLDHWQVPKPDLDEVSGGLEIERTATPEEDDEECAEELRDEGGQDRHWARLSQVVDPQEGTDVLPFGRHAAGNLFPTLC